MNTITKFALAALAAGAFSTLPSKAETPNPFTKHGLPIPGTYFKKKESQQPATVAVSMSEKRVGQHKQPMSKAGKMRTKRLAWTGNH